MSERREGKGAGSEHFFRNFFPFQRVTDGICYVTHMETPAFLQRIATVESFSFRKTFKFGYNSCLFLEKFENVELRNGRMEG